MIDYKFLGGRIKALRLQKKITQERLAEAAGFGVTHISHIETGNSVPSLQTLVDILNVLDCSADELFCMEVTQAKPALNNWLCDLVSDCNSIEMKLIADTVISLKNSMRRLKISEEI